MSRTAQVVVCGAGIAGVSAAYHLARLGFKDIVIVDPLPPLSLTSDRSTECYRNWWPDASMIALMNRSIDIMERLSHESGNVFRMNRRGYLYVTGDAERVDGLIESSTRIAELGAGSLRTHTNTASVYKPEAPDLDAEEARGGDLLLDPALIHKHHPYLADQAVAALHVRRAGWLSAQQLGSYLLEKARALGVATLSSAVTSVNVSHGRVEGVLLSSGEHLSCPILVNAAGPYLKQISALLGVDLPVRTELHLKVSFKDHLRVLPRESPLLIWLDEQKLPWDASEASSLQADPSTRWLTESFPAGVHVRPEGSGESQAVLMLWDYKPNWMEPKFPPPLDDAYPEIALRGLSTMIPGLRRYFNRAPRPYVDGGYYVKTPENRLLSGPLPLEGAYVLGGLSGYGIMSSCGAGELLAAHIAGSVLPPYAPAFSPHRYTNWNHQVETAEWDDEGEL